MLEKFVVVLSSKFLVIFELCMHYAEFLVVSPQQTFCSQHIKFSMSWQTCPCFVRTPQNAGCIYSILKNYVMVVSTVSIDQRNTCLIVGIYDHNLDLSVSHHQLCFLDAEILPTIFDNTIIASYLESFSLLQRLLCFDLIL